MAKADPRPHHLPHPESEECQVPRHSSLPFCVPSLGQDLQRRCRHLGSQLPQELLRLHWRTILCPCGLRAGSQSRSSYCCWQ
eukprot:12384121-Heterocapsa_arctica.AAC.1